jgi:hypothetical protein
LVVVVYFQNGNIESIRQTERLGIKEFVEKRRAEKEGKKGRVIMVSSPQGEPGGQHGKVQPMREGDNL